MSDPKRPPHSAQVGPARNVQPAVERARPPHPATLQRREQSGAPPPHPATVQRKAAQRSSLPVKPLHPATLQRRERPGALPSHPATLQRKPMDADLPMNRSHCRQSDPGAGGDLEWQGENAVCCSCPSCNGSHGVKPGHQFTTVQQSRKPKSTKPKQVKIPAWLKTWRNIRCYANDTAQAMDRRMTNEEIEEYLTRFIKEEHSKGVRGHCSDGLGNPGKQNQQTTDDLVIFHSWHRENRPW
ncbi:MAG TPA: hypothetical protein VH877_31325 [Polyangia bacterium]|jgi:hypothetical protein|nr:hypothetical protein [Polyangia bacterium]